jgi:sodium--glutamate symport carrier gltS
MPIVSSIILLFLALLGTFFQRRRQSIFQYVPLALVIGISFLIISKLLDIRELTQDWSSLPSLLINVVFACLFLGQKLFGIRKIWRFAGPQIVFGQILAWGQYIVGGLLALLVLVPVFGMSPLSGALIEISFEGGHGTAAGLAPLFNELGFAEGADIALGLATIGIAAGLLTGLAMNFVFQRKRTSKPLKSPVSEQRIQKPLVKAFRGVYDQNKQRLPCKPPFLPNVTATEYYWACDRYRLRYQATHVAG